MHGGIGCMKQGEFITGTHADLHVSRRRAWKDSVLEKAIVKVIRDGLTACRIPQYEVKARTPCAKCHLWTVAASEPGIPDLIGWIPAALNLKRSERHGPVAIPLFIEVKRPKGGIEGEAQKQFIERANRDGGVAMFARDWDTVAGTLRRVGIKIPEGL
jgi:hypothetical protein